MISMLPYVEKVDKSDPNQTAVIAQVEPGSLRQVAGELAKEFGTEIKIDILELYVTPTMETADNRQQDNSTTQQDDDSEEDENTK